MKIIKNKKWLRREIAKRARFSQSDVKVIMDTFEDIIVEVIKKKERLIYTGIFRVDVKEIAAHNGFDAVRKEAQFIDTSYKIFFKASRSLLALVREPKDSDYDDEEDDEEYE